MSDLLKSVMPTHRSIRLVLDVSSNWVPLHRLPIWLHQSLSVWSIAIPFCSNCGFSYPLSNGSVSIRKYLFYSNCGFSYPLSNGSVSIRNSCHNGSISIQQFISQWIYFNPTIPGYLSTWYIYSYNTILGLFQPDNKIPIYLIRWSLSTLNKNNSKSKIQLNNPSASGSFGITGHCPYTSFYE